MIKLNTREDWVALGEMLKVIAVCFAIVYLVGSTGAYENGAIDTQTYIVRLFICFGLILF